jgi:hypothetical protein
MKRFFSHVALCFALLLIGFVIFSPYTRAENNLLDNLLNLPAPPPPNPFFESRRAIRAEKLYDKNNPPKDDAPIEELLDFWQAQSAGYTELGYNIKPSEKSLARILDEIAQKPETLSNFLNVMPENRETAEFVKRLYDNEFAAGEKYEKYHKQQIKQWLTFHSDYYSDELARMAQKAADENEYVTHQNELLALARVDFEKARPILERLYNDRNQRVAPVLARWAFYRHALAEESSSDIEKYRDELKAVVEDKSATAGMRDLALDALVKEKDWDGRDDWYFSLLGDETLHDLRVNGQSYTGLTTILYYAPPEKYLAKMLELVNSENPAVRGAAIRNLLFFLNKDNVDVARALLPWLENPKWAKEAAGGERQRLVQILQQFQLPESVPGLIAVLNERALNETASRNNPWAMSGNTNANVAVVSNGIYSEEIYPYRGSAISALATQKDPRAISPLRAVLPELVEYERGNAVRALLMCGGFTIAEQVEALESIAENVKTETEKLASESNTAMSADRMTNSMSDEDEDYSEENSESVSRVEMTIANTMMTNHSYSTTQKPFNPSDIKPILAINLVNTPEPGEELVFAVADRIDVLDKKNPPLANALRKIMYSWRGAAINSLLLKDLKNKRADADAVVKLLSLRKNLREKQSNEIFEARGGNETAYGISACLLEDGGEYDLILTNGTNEAKTAMLACARLIRGNLPVRKVAENLQSPDKTLALASERYLETEDSIEARRIVLALHPNEAKILGATTFFETNGASNVRPEFLYELLTSVSESASFESFIYSPYAENMRRSEKRLQKEVRGNAELSGVYSYDGNHIRIYQDKAVFSWDDNVSRYRERALQKEELDNFKNFLASRRADEFAPFLSPCEGCQAKQLLMLGRGGGRRVFLKSERAPEFFAELDRTFAVLRQTPAKLRYGMEKTIAGLEILFADENLHARTVWKNGGDLRLLIDDQSLREQINRELEKQNEADEQVEEPDYEKIERIREQRREKKEYDSFSWRSLANDKLGGLIAQPPSVEFLPARDALVVKTDGEQWKARAANFEMRADEEGLYKITRGQIVKIREGYYDSPVITPDGRWAVATKYDERPSLVRVNLATGKEFEVKTGDYPLSEAVVFVPSVNKTLIFAGYYNDEHDSSAVRVGDYFLLDAATGTMQKAKGEFRPLVQQTFRPLQPAANAGEFWAAVPNIKRNQTVFGAYDAKTFTFKPLVTIPQINFDSMAMWFDAAEKKLYFIYEGHLLALPVK